MCGIVGIISQRRTKVLNKILLSIENLEYRGYDSIGFAVLKKKKSDKTENFTLVYEKTCGNLENLLAKLNSKLDSGTDSLFNPTFNSKNSRLNPTSKSYGIEFQKNSQFDSHIGIGHTRWATHGEANEKNAHPHVGYGMALVHNGIVNNFNEIQKEVMQHKITLKSDTDTELFLHYIEILRKQNLSILKCIQIILEKFEGNFAIAFIDEQNPDTIYAFKKGIAPLILGRFMPNITNKTNYKTNIQNELEANSKNENHIQQFNKQHNQQYTHHIVASDINSISHMASEFAFLEAGQVAVITHSEAKIYQSPSALKNETNEDRGNSDEKERLQNISQENISHGSSNLYETLYPLTKVKIKFENHNAHGNTALSNSKNGYENFMLKEINDQVSIASNFFENDYLKFCSENSQSNCAQSKSSPNGLSNTNTNSCNESSHNASSNSHSDQSFLCELNKFDEIHIIGCGSAYYAGCISKKILEKFLKTPITCHISSEFTFNDYMQNYMQKHNKNHIQNHTQKQKNNSLKTHNQNDDQNKIQSNSKNYSQSNNNQSEQLCGNQLSIFISQSGETFDTIVAHKKAKQLGHETVGIVNTPFSTLSQIANKVIFTHAGVEKSVASTKAVTSQIMTMIKILQAELINTNNPNAAKELQASCQNLNSSIASVILNTHLIENAAKQLIDCHSSLFLSKDMLYFTCMEAALKMKELSYIHAEAIPLGELKHGPLALVDETIPIFIFYAEYMNKLDNFLTTIEEVLSRKAKIWLVTDACIINTANEATIARTDYDKQTPEDKKYDKHKEYKDLLKKQNLNIIPLPKMNIFTAPIVFTVFSQLLSYFSAKFRKKNIDRPRNLAKSVTVE